MGKGCGASSMPPLIGSSRRPSQLLRRKGWRYMTRESENGMSGDKEVINMETGTLMPQVKDLLAMISPHAAGLRRTFGPKTRMAAPLPPRSAQFQPVGWTPTTCSFRRGTSCSNILLGDAHLRRKGARATEHRRQRHPQGGLGQQELQREARMDFLRCLVRRG